MHALMRRAPVSAQPVSAGVSRSISRRPLGARGKAVQAKLRIGSQEDPLEREADRAAETVVSRELAPPPLGPASPTIQRQCAGCDEADREDEIRMKAEPRGPEPRAGAETRAAAALTGGGAPLAADLRAHFEPRFGADFSGVRVHADAPAGDAADALSARAFTLGQDIAFATGEYQPSTPSGRRLLAHELAHTLQGGPDSSPVVRRQGRSGRRSRRAGRFPYVSTSREPDPSGGGATAFEERVRVPPTEHDGVLEGEVERREYVPARGRQAERTIHSDRVTVRFDPSSCRVTIPHRFAFQQQQTASNAWTCEGPPAPPAAVPPVPADQLAEIKRRYIEAMNDGLNGWYTVRVQGCEDVCPDQDIEIRVEASEDAGNPDTTINVINRRGRGDAGTICVGDSDYHFAVHEGIHNVLGHGDEYRERDARVLAAVPEWGTPERVRDEDWSRASADFGRFTLLHARHFAFVPAFLEAAFPGCQARLIERARPVLPEFGFSVGVGYMHRGGHGLYVDLGLELGVPADRLRQWNLLVGAHGRLLGTLEGESLSAWLLGARIGLERRFAPSSGGLTLGGFAEAGVGWFGMPRGSDEESVTSAYGELGLTAGYRAYFPGSVGLSIGGEVAAGTMIGRPGVIGGPGEEPDTESEHWVRAGIRAAWEF